MCIYYRNKNMQRGEKKTARRGGDDFDLICFRSDVEVFNTEMGGK